MISFVHFFSNFMIIIDSFSGADSPRGDLRPVWRCAMFRRSYTNPTMCPADKMSPGHRLWRQVPLHYWYAVNLPKLLFKKCKQLFINRPGGRVKARLIWLSCHVTSLCNRKRLVFVKGKLFIFLM